MKQLLRSIIKGTIIGVIVGIALNYYPLIEDVQFNESELLVPYGSFSFNFKTYKSTIRIISEDSACSAVVIDDRYALTAAHCVTKSLNRIDVDKTFYVFDEDGRATLISAKPVALQLSRDVALLMGNFVDFAYAKVDFMGLDPLEVDDQLISCGFPSAQELVYCVKWRLKGAYDFRHVAQGVVIQRGCSGGPVFNKFGNVIGVNSAVFGEDFLIGPVVGVFHDFGIEPR